MLQRYKDYKIAFVAKTQFLYAKLLVDLCHLRASSQLILCQSKKKFAYLTLSTFNLSMECRTFLWHSYRRNVLQDVYDDDVMNLYDEMCFKNWLKVKLMIINMYNEVNYKKFKIGNFKNN